jgi:A/G-specific adenine glycosylase
MLQQTQVDRVVPLYRVFLKKFPTWRALDRAPQAEVVRAWKGLGYNLLAVRLKRLAADVVARGGLPRDVEGLEALHGIGPYTARAIRVFAFRERGLAPDTNLRRVLNRVFKGPTADPKRFDEVAWARWESTLPLRLSYDANQALMDLGATVCKAGRPLCEACPLKASCRSYPRILTMKALPRAKTPRRERLVDGSPERIYRGRVIERLRAGPVALRDLDALGRAVRPAYARSDRAWLASLVAKLEKDGLISSEKGRIRLA